MDLSFLFQILVLSPLVIGPALIYLILRRVFKVKNRVLSIVITLLVSLVVASFLPLLIPSMDYNRHLVLPWGQCGTVSINNYNSSCPNCLYDVSSRIGYAICHFTQLYEQVLIIAAIAFILASFAYDFIKKKKK